MKKILQTVVVLGFLGLNAEAFASWSLPSVTRTTESTKPKSMLSDRERLAVLENETHEFMGHALPDALAQIQAQLDQATKTIEALQQSIDANKTAQADLIKRVNVVLSQLENQTQITASMPESSTKVEGTTSVAVEKKDDLTQYQKAFALLQANKNEASLEAFNRYLDDFPSGKYTPNVLYWMASLELRQGQTEQAISRLVTLVNDFASSQKAPSAWFKLAKIYHFKGDLDHAKSSLEMILSKYAQSSEAQEASELMKSWFEATS